MSTPFDSPQSAALSYADDLVLADLGSRFGAKLLDGLVAALPFLPAVLAIWGYQAVYGDMPEDPPPVILAITALGMVGVLGVGVYQWIAISRTGQSIGKKYLGIRIVRLDGSPVDFVSGVILRSWILGFATGVLNQCCLGWIVTLVDVVMIFGEERRCLHDVLAGTKVVVA
jgi:uncharacterized RDD family membrane protein YckC